MAQGEGGRRVVQRRPQRRGRGILSGDIVEGEVVLAVVGRLRGEKALELLRKRRFDLVLLDVTMPRLDGCGTLRELRARHRDLPVVLMSGYDHGDLGIEGDVLPEAFLSKPFTRDQLAAVLGTAIGS